MRPIKPSRSHCSQIENGLLVECEALFTGRFFVVDGTRGLREADLFDRAMALARLAVRPTTRDDDVR